MVAKKVGKFSHCKCEKGDILSQVEAFFFLSSVLSFPPFLKWKCSKQKGKYLCLLSQFIIAFDNGQNINLS